MKLTHLLCLFAVLLALVGCGGSGSGGSGGGTGTGALFATDSLNDADHVWITIEQVTLTKQGGGTITVFDDPNGVTIDLRSLRDINGEKFSFLSAIPAGTYTGISVTVDKDVLIYPTGSSTAVTRQFAGNNGTTAVLSLNFPSPITITNNSHIVLDFSLSDWNDDGTTVTGTPFLKVSNGTGVDDLNRHDRTDMEGAISQLSGTAPNQTFVLIRGHNHISVTVNSNTALYNSNGTTTPILANGQQVTVHGTWDVTTNSFIADSVEIHGNGTPHDHGVHGSLVSSDPVAGTFVLHVDHVHGFMPENTDVNVTTSPSTVYLGSGGATITYTEFFLALQAGVEVRVSGDYNAATNTIAATSVRIETEDGGGNETEIRGVMSNVNSGTATLDVTATEWEGLNLPPNTVVHVTMDANTVLRFNGSHLNQGDFFTVVANGMTAKVEGVYDSNTHTMAATEIDVTSS